MINNKLKKKKGVSPVIATILLVVIAVVLVGIILAWSRHFVQTNTANADSTINTNCNGAYVSFSSCDYNTISGTIKFTLNNSGQIDFKTDSNLSATLIDANLDVNTVVILEGAGLTKGQTSSVTISDYFGVNPVSIEIRSTQCPGSTWIEKECK